MIFHKKNLSTRARSARSEKRAAIIIGARRQPNSGALPVAGLKADLKNKEWLIEDKTTSKESFSVTLKLWRTLSNQSYKIGRKPILRLELKGETLYVLDSLGFHKLFKE